MSHRFVTSADGTRIAVFESGPIDGPVLIAVHGYPDNHTVWNGVAAVLADRYRVVQYDVRGAGESDKPSRRRDYLMARLVEDFRAVADDVSPSAPVHLVAHDWGSIQSWAAVTDPSTRDRVASYTSVSGPHLDYVGAWMRDRSHPRESLRQLAHSWYIAAFQIPLLPDRIVQLKAVERALERVESKGSPGGVTQQPLVRSTADKVNGIKLYRANMPRVLARPRQVPTTVPVQVLAPIDDNYVSVPLATQAPSGWVEDLSVVEIAGSHWVVSESPERIAAYVDEFARRHGAAPAAATKRRGRKSTPAGS